MHEGLVGGRGAADEQDEDEETLHPSTVWGGGSEAPIAFVNPYAAAYGAQRTRKAASGRLAPWAM